MPWKEREKRTKAHSMIKYHDTTVPTAVANITTSTPPMLLWKNEILFLCRGRERERDTHSERVRGNLKSVKVWSPLVERDEGS